MLLVRAQIWGYINMQISLETISSSVFHHQTYFKSPSHPRSGSTLVTHCSPLVRTTVLPSFVTGWFTTTSCRIPSSSQSKSCAATDPESPADSPSALSTVSFIRPNLGCSRREVTPQSDCFPINSKTADHILSRLLQRFVFFYAKLTNDALLYSQVSFTPSLFVFQGHCREKGET